MSDFDIRDTAAYKIIDQMISHAWGGTKWDERDMVIIYRLFNKRGGSWELIVNGDPNQFSILENSIGDYLNYRDVYNMARGLCS